MEKRLLTIKELSEYISYSQTSIRRMMASGEIPHIRLPRGSYRFDKEDIDAWLKDCKRQTEVDRKRFENIVSSIKRA
ncbi:helix-turn-helix transcriptional regulator [Candidatus Zixiibacteriota bacterium]